MRVRFPLAWIIIKHKKTLNILVKQRLRNKINETAKPTFFYSYRFSSIFYPGSLKNINLFLRASTNKNDTELLSKNGTYKNNKIIIKQSYLLITWIYYLCKNTDNHDDKNRNNFDKKPSFFIYPYSQSKTTLIRSPLAHKTFSQEQFLTRYYSISVSFKPFNSLQCNDVVDSVNGSVYSSNFIRNQTPIISTNLFFLKKISYIYSSSDLEYYSYYCFSKNTKTQKPHF